VNWKKKKRQSEHAATSDADLQRLSEVPGLADVVNVLREAGDEQVIARGCRL
jgi:hypothetical protein